MNGSGQQYAGIALKQRRSVDAVNVDRQLILQNCLVMDLLAAIPDYAVLLDGAGQVLVANQRLLELLGDQTGDGIIGKRTGEMFHCSFAESGADGCGTSRWCLHCGALQVVTMAMEQQRQVAREVSLVLDRQNVLEVEVVASPVQVQELATTLCVFRDLSAAKRHQVLEKIFFHDIMNTLGGLRGVAEVLRRDDLLPPADRPRYQAWLLDLTEQLIEEIDQQRKLLAAERGEFVAEVAVFAVAHLLEQVRHTYLNHTVAEGRILRVEPVGDLIAVSDPTIVRRILGNLVKNALEAVDIGQEVVVSVTHTATEVTFLVANPGVIPDEIQRQLFTRTISSKAAIGRGIGTYSAKLFTERYLDGRIGFSSSATAGTCFWITLPQTCPA